MTTGFKSLKSGMLSNRKVKEAYDRLAPEFEIAGELIAARAKSGLTQEELAARMGTTQSAVARIESGRHIPSMKTITRYAEATATRVSLRLVPLKRQAGGASGA